MIVELSNNEIELISKALKSWEEAKRREHMMTTMITAVLCPPELRDTEMAKLRNETADVEKETSKREQQSTLLQAKLYQAQARDSEHTLEQPA